MNQTLSLPSPAPGSARSAARREPQGEGSATGCWGAVAGAMFAAGVTSLLLPAPQARRPEAAVSPAPAGQVPARVELMAEAAPALVPFAPVADGPARQDGLIAFSPAAPIVEAIVALPAPWKDEAPAWAAVDWGRGPVESMPRAAGAAAMREHVEPRRLGGAALNDFAHRSAKAGGFLADPFRSEQPAMITGAEAVRLMKLASQGHGNTNHVKGYVGACESGAAVCSIVDGVDLIEYKATGQRTWHTYDPAAPMGRRNHVLNDGEKGAAAEYRASPLVLDLNGDGVRTSNRIVRFDVDGDGRVDRIFDVSTKDGVLCFDNDGNGISGDHARELLGDKTDLDGDGLADGFADGFEALAGLVAKAVREGALAEGAWRSGRLEAAHLEALARRYGLRLRVGSLRARAVPLAEAGVTELRLASGPKVRVQDFDGQRNDVLRQAGAVFARADGSEGAYEDVWFAQRAFEGTLAGLPVVPEAFAGETRRND